MSNMNVTQLQPPPQLKAQTTSEDPVDKNGEFLALRMLNKRARVRVSPGSLEYESLRTPGRVFAVANSRGWFAAASRNADLSNGAFQAIYWAASTCYMSGIVGH
ncbi:hypothetical protein BKA93DRAFT_792005 [Sparassis latifolia]